MARKNKRPTRVARRRRARRSVPIGIGGGDYRLSMARYDAMIRDPCGAAFAKAPYAGTESGYYVRINAAITPNATVPAGVVGTKVPINWQLQFQPTTFPCLVFGGSTSASITPLFVYNNVLGSFISNSAVRAFRPIAACARWIPNGALVDRAGVIGLGYATTPSRGVGDPAAPSDIVTSQQNMMYRSSNGEDDHEIKWLPTSVDEQFVIPSTNQQFTGAGTINITGVKTDGVYTTTTNVDANGYVELTLIVEWTPAGGAGIAVSPVAPPPFTSQDYQSRITDIGAFLTSSIRAGARAAGAGMARGAVKAVVQSLDSLTTSRRYGRSFPMLHDEL